MSDHWDNIGIKISAKTVTVFGYSWNNGHIL